MLDETEIRRRQPTLATNWGNEIAVFSAIACLHRRQSGGEFSDTEVCRAVAMAANTVCSGEILQTQHRCKFQASRREYFRVIEMKTAELFIFSCDLAALLSEATTRQRAACDNSARRLARRIRFMTIARICSVRKKLQANRLAQTGKGQIDKAGFAGMGARQCRRQGTAAKFGQRVAAGEFFRGQRIADQI